METEKTLRDFFEGNEPMRRITRQLAIEQTSWEPVRASDILSVLVEHGALAEVEVEAVPDDVCYEPNGLPDDPENAKR